MQITKFILAASAFAVAYAVELTDSTFNGIVAGSPFNITWSEAVGSVTLLLKNGPVLNLLTVNTIASGLTGASGSFEWTPSASLPNGLYVIEIDDSTAVPNYSPQFTLTGGSASSISASGSTSSQSSISSSISSSSSLPSITSMTSTASSSSTTGTRNSTTSTTTKSSSSTASKTSSSTGSSTSTTAPSSANSISSPLAMVFLALAAIVCLN